MRKIWTKLLSCLTLLLAVSISLVSPALDWSYEDTRFAMNMVARAFGDVCWYEHYKWLPLMKDPKEPPLGCDNVGFHRNYMSKEDHYRQYPEQLLPNFVEFNNKAFESLGLAQDYKNQCAKYWRNTDAAPEADETEAVGDSGRKYPLKALAHCLLHTLRKRAGDRSIKAVMSEGIYSKADFRDVLLERHNAHRALHGAVPLIYDKELEEGAQKLADHDARECEIIHSKGVKFRNSRPGENICRFYPFENRALGASRCAFIWYSEIVHYPFPNTYYDGRGEMLMKVGHFTQELWNDTKYVGFGYGTNPKCNNGKGLGFVVGWYYPPGNWRGVEAHNKNVFPMKKV